MLASESNLIDLREAYGEKQVTKCVAIILLAFFLDDKILTLTTGKQINKNYFLWKNVG